jgi:S-adenosyl-L-methionine hydrolase (adenosine-forming)
VALSVTFLSDYGLRDEFVGVVHAVIAHECPTARVIDLSHGVPRQSVLAGALMLARSLPYATPGVHLAVVDPDVGARRRAIALRTAEEARLLVGPDNGLLIPAAMRFGGIAEAVEISHSPWRLEPVSATFHGRDLFAPVAAHLALGARLEEAGEPIEVGSLSALELPSPEIGADRVTAHAIHTDGYGNVTLNVDASMLSAGPLEPGGRIEVRAPDGRFDALWAGTFADVGRGDLLLYEDSSGALALAASGGNAAGLLDLRPGAKVELRPR